MTTTSRTSQPDSHAAQATGAWLAFLDRLTEGRLDQPCRWYTIERMAEVLGTLGDHGERVSALTGRLNRGLDAPEGPGDVESFLVESIGPESEGKPGEWLIRGLGEGNVFSLTVEEVTYLPCPMAPDHGVVIVSVDQKTRPPGIKLPHEAYVTPGTPNRWAVGGFILANATSELIPALFKAPSSIWYDFTMFSHWIGQHLGVPPPRTTAEGLDSPFVVETLTSALGRYREQSQSSVKRHGAKATQGEVDVIASTAISLGLQPTVAMLTRVLGRGSASTLHPLLRGFYRRAMTEGLLPGAAASSGPAVPPAFLDLLEQLRGAARSDVETAFAPQRLAVAEREAACAAREAALAQAQVEMEEAREHAASAEKERARYVGHLETRLATAEQDRDQALQSTAACEAALQRLDAKAAAERKEAESYRSRVEGEMERMLDRVHALDQVSREQQVLLAETKAAQEAERETHAAEKKALNERIAQLEQEGKSARWAADQRIAEAQERLSARDREAQHWQEESARTRQDLDRERLQADEWHHRANELDQRVKQLDAALAAQRARADAVQSKLTASFGEQERLKGLLGKCRSDHE